MAGLGALATGCARPAQQHPGPFGQSPYGPLRDPDANGVRLPAGFSSRIVARSGERPVKGARAPWHFAPDGGACFAAPGGGWIYASNAELSGGGGVSALALAADGRVTDAYPILGATMMNCAGGATPWGTWLSCEEFDEGRVFECDPTGRQKAAVRPALGVFKHEAVAVDPAAKRLYMTEDRPDGRLYRFTPAGDLRDLSAGRLEAAQVLAGGDVRWWSVPDPSGREVATRLQADRSTRFSGGEGIWWHAGQLYFTTKGDSRVWHLDTRRDVIRVLYDPRKLADPPLLYGDNITATRHGHLLIAEDYATMRLSLMTPAGRTWPLLQVPAHTASEITGPAFDPSGARLYFSSQRGLDGRGVTFEVTGPFRHG